MMLRGGLTSCPNGIKVEADGYGGTNSLIGIVASSFSKSTFGTSLFCSFYDEAVSVVGSSSIA